MLRIHVQDCPCSKHSTIREVPIQQFLTRCVPGMHADSLLAILAPRAPPKHVQQRHDAETADADGGPDDPARFSLPANASPAKKRLVAFLRQRLRLPDVALVILFGVRPWVWAAFLAWMIGAPIAHRLEVCFVATYTIPYRVRMQCCMHLAGILWVHLLTLFACGRWARCMCWARSWRSS